jgi:hypothetical protein
MADQDAVCPTPRESTAVGPTIFDGACAVRTRQDGSGEAAQDDDRLDHPDGPGGGALAGWTWVLVGDGGEACVKLARTCQATGGPLGAR